MKNVAAKLTECFMKKLIYWFKKSSLPKEIFYTFRLVKK